VIFILLLIWFLPKLWRGIKGLFRQIYLLLGGSKGDGGEKGKVLKPVQTEDGESGAPPQK